MVVVASVEIALVAVLFAVILRRGATLRRVPVRQERRRHAQARAVGRRVGGRSGCNGVD
jgi:hypothetical protein